MVVKIPQVKETYGIANEICEKKVFKDFEKLVAKFSNCLLEEEQDFLTKFYLQQVTFRFTRGSSI